jgi:hypothetical protein
MSSMTAKRNKKNRADTGATPPPPAESSPPGKARGRQMVGVDPDIHQQLKLLAQRNSRPLTWELRLLFIKALRENGLWPPGKETTAPPPS